MFLFTDFPVSHWNMRPPKVHSIHVFPRLSFGALPMKDCTERKGLARLTVIEIGVICRRHVPSSPVAVCFVGVRVCCVVHGWRAESSRKEGRFHVNTELGTC